MGSAQKAGAAQVRSLKRQDFFVPAGQSGEPLPENVKQVEVNVPRSTGLQCVWCFTDHSPHRLLSLLPGVFGFRSHTAPGLWILSVCLAEIEKHKGKRSRWERKRVK